MSSSRSSHSSGSSHGSVSSHSSVSSHGSEGGASGLRDVEGHRKLKRFMSFLLDLEGDRLHEVLRHLPEEFEKQEDDICSIIKRISNELLSCRSKLCCCK